MITIELTDVQRQTLQANPGEPVAIVDPEDRRAVTLDIPVRLFDNESEIVTPFADEIKRFWTDKPTSRDLCRSAARP